MPIMTSIPPKAVDPPVKKNAFVHKLYSMLSNPKLAHLIWWIDTPEANTFALYPSKEFADALSGYFKHGNVASFVRQLHMYGFHKVLEPHSLAPNGKDSPVWEFRHSSGKFSKNDEKSLVYIKRRLLLNLQRNLVVDNDQPRSSLTPPPPPPLLQPPSYDHYAAARSHYPTSVPGVPGAVAAYGPLAHYPLATSPYHNYVSQVHAANVGAGHVAHYTAAAAASSAAAGVAAAAGATAQNGSHASHPIHASLGSHPSLPISAQLSSHQYPHSTAFSTPYQHHGMMLPPPPPPHDGRMYQVRWHLGVPVYAPYYPVLTPTPAEDAAAIQDGSALKFRKPWEQLPGAKTRHPSLLCDPLAPSSLSSLPSDTSLPKPASGTNSPTSRPEPIKLPPLGKAVLPLVGNLPGASIAEHPVDPAHPSLPHTLVPPVLNAWSLWASRSNLGSGHKHISEKIRPSLVELHYPNTSLSNLSLSGRANGVSDSLASNSLSIFSGISSISSTSSGRTSSFGSISHIVIADGKGSIGPRDDSYRSDRLSSITTIKKDTNACSPIAEKSPEEAPQPQLNKSKVEFLLEASESTEEPVIKRPKLELSPISN